MTVTLNQQSWLQNPGAPEWLEPPTATPLQEPMGTWTQILHAEPDGSVVAGFWRCEPGLSRWDFSDRSEVIQVLGGVMHVHQDGGERLTLREGSAAAFPRGWTGTWEIEAAISKFFTIYR